MFLHEKTHRYLKNDYQFFDALKTKDRKIRGNRNLLTKVKVKHACNGCHDLLMMSINLTNFIHFKD